jgi:two-component system, chemotaxis family, CheB/CheR fusion protein
MNKSPYSSNKVASVNQNQLEEVDSQESINFTNYKSGDNSPREVENEAQLQNLLEIRDNQQKNRARYVVGVGASAGGLDALEQLFSHTYPDIGCAFVVVQHLSPDFKSLMEEILGRITALEVYRVEHGMVVRPNSVYLIPPRKNMIISNGRLLLEEQNEGKSVQLPIDIFLKSLAQDYGPFAVGVILSGSGSDGSRGIKDIHQSGGLVLIQDLATAKFDGMPRAAIELNIADHVIAPDKMTSVIQEHIQLTGEFPLDATQVTPVDSDNCLEEIFRLLQARYGVDFRDYRANTVDRRLERRMNLNQIEKLETYSAFLKTHPEELSSLYHDLLIGVTQFFRDPQAFQTLEKVVYPELFSNASETGEIRVWCAGCATGEEAYSLAIGLHDFAKTYGRQDIDLKIFATDLHHESLETASQGVFSAEALCNIPQRIVETYFEEEKPNYYRISSEIRRLVVFAPQNVINDPPFTKIDLITCRNLLIYIESSLQQKILSLFLFALRGKGFLFLGPSETIGLLRDEFDVRSSQWNVFSKRRTHTSRSSKNIAASVASTSVAPRFNNLRARGSMVNLDKVAKDELTSFAYEALLNQFVKAGLLVNETYQLIHVFGEGKNLLEFPQGRPTTQVLNLVTENLKGPLSSALVRAKKEQQPVVYRGIKLEKNFEGDNQGNVVSKLIVKPLISGKKQNFFFCYIEKEVEDLAQSNHQYIVSGSPQVGQEQQIVDLQTELQYTREHLQAANEELETSNEELQATNEELVATNEELQSTNEELQSTNEELQSTNEELHSVNEELHTVNAEYQLKIEELSQLTNDMENFLRSTRIGTLFLDTDLNIRRFTPQVSSIMNLLDRDIMRPISHITPRLDISQTELVDFVSKSLNNEETLIQEVRSQIGNETYLMRALPYRDDKERLGGVVLTFVDITPTKKVEAEIRNYAARLENSNKDLQNFTYILTHDLMQPMRDLQHYLKEWRIDPQIINSEEGLISLGQLESSVSTMRSLLELLIDLSQVTEEGVDFENVNCSAILEEALHSLRLKIDEHNVNIQYSLLPRLKVDKFQLIQVFQNILENCINRCSESNPKITITAEHVDNDWLFNIEFIGKEISTDEGEYMFDLLSNISNSKDGFENQRKENLGLAICKKIIERHGGRIWLSSGKDNLMYFRFTISCDPLSGLKNTDVENEIELT